MGAPRARHNFYVRMDKKSARASEAKLTALGATEATPKDEHEAAKLAFEQALAKTKADAVASGDADPEPEGEEKIVVESVPAKKPTPTKTRPVAKAKPTVDPAEEKFRALEAKLAEVTAKLTEREKPKAVEAQKRDDLKEIAQHLENEFGDAEGKALTPVFGLLLQKLQASEARQEAMEKLLQDGSKRWREAQAKTGRQELTAKYERLASDDAWDMVRAQGDALIEKAPERFNSPEEAYAHVAGALYGEAEETETNADDGDELAEEIAASSVTAPAARTRERKLSNEEKSKQIFDYLVKNPDDAAGAKRLARQLRTHG